jgi:adenylate cyclase
LSGQRKTNLLATMGTEIERKFLIQEIPPEVASLPGRRMRQGYLAVAADGGECRIRHCEGECTLTVKQGKGLKRTEDEMLISESLFDQLWPLTEHRRIEKVRRCLPTDSLTIEIDQYEGALEGLHVAEIEFPDETTAAAWHPPMWFGPEVTNDPKYKNQQLALHSAPTLPQPLN